MKKNIAKRKRAWTATKRAAFTTLRTAICSHPMPHKDQADLLALLMGQVCEDPGYIVPYWGGPDI